MAKWLAEHAEWLGCADYCGVLYDIGAYPGAVPSQNPAHRVRGEVYRLDDPQEILPILDGYEEFGEQFPEPNEFIRTVQDVRLGGRHLSAWVYLYNHSTDHLKILTDGCFQQDSNNP